MIDDLLELQRRQREAHLTKDAGLLVSMFADDFTSIKDGEVTRPTREMSLERFSRYFAQVGFLAWDDIEEPVIEVSGEMATVLVRKKVHITYEGGEELTIFAWLEVWRRANGRWELTTVVSTQRSDPLR